MPKAQLRVAIAGFQHETNTFIAEPTRLEHFEMADSWPGLLEGDAVIEGTKGMNLPIAGFAEAAMAHKSVTLAPILWCAAEPWGKVSDAAFDTIRRRIVSGLMGEPRPDGIYFDLHGAMVTQSFEDGEGALLQAIRDAIGDGIPIVVSLDMHANVTWKMVELADALTIYRTYPHLDMAQTGARAFTLLSQIMNGNRPAKAWRQGNYAIPLHAQHTGTEPVRGLYEAVSEQDHGQVSVDLALGFTASDIADMGPSVVAYAPDQRWADMLADNLANRLKAAESYFDALLLSPKDAVAQALALRSDKPVIIGDVQDNPGAGATSDTTGLLRELISQSAPSAVLGLMHDPHLANQAHAVGVGEGFEAAIGGTHAGDAPLTANVTVEALSDGQCVYTGAMYGGGVATMGLTALLRLSGTGTRIVVTSIRNQCLDQAQFRHLGVVLEEEAIICVKSTAHFRADFEGLASHILLTAAPGAFPCELEKIDYRYLRNGVRLGPIGPPMRAQ